MSSTLASAPRTRSFADDRGVRVVLTIRMRTIQAFRKATQIRTAILTALALTFLGADAFAQAPHSEFPTARVAFFNIERVAAESAIGEAAIARLEEFHSKTNLEIQNRNQQLEEARERLRQGVSVLSSDARLERERKIQNFELDLERFIEDAEAQFLGIQQDVESDFLVKLGPVIEGVAQEKDVHFVFTYPGPGFVWADPRFDITSDIIEQLGAATNN